LEFLEILSYLFIAIIGHIDHNKTNKKITISSGTACTQCIYYSI